MTATAALLAAFVLSGTPDPDALVDRPFGYINVKVPGAWTPSISEGTFKWAAPDGTAQMTLDVGATQSKMSSAACVDKIVAAMGGGEKWERLKVANASAAKSTAVDAAGKTSSVVSHTYVGCNGTTTWALIISMPQEHRARLDALTKKIVKSLRYNKLPHK